MSASKSRKSKAVPLTILTAIALATTAACNNRRKEVRDCVDAQNHIVPDGRCQSPGGSGGGGAGAYHYVYGGASGGNVGDTVSGGSSTPEAGAEVVSEETARGGFGHGGEGGAGEGE
jgi:hypothetical protein